MKSFLKYTLATITGIILTSLLFFFVLMGSLSIMMASANKQVTLRKNSVLVLNTGQMIPERGIDDPFSSFDLVDFTFKPSPGVNDIIKNLEKAADDDHIKGVLIENGPMINGWGKAEEIRLALQRFKESGKFVIAYAENFLTQEAYYLSSVADEIYLNPAAIMEFKGISSEVMFFKKALEKVGIAVEIVRHGRFKGAVEPFMGDKLSDENRSQITRFINNIWNHALEGISKERGITTDELNRMADDLLASKSGSAVEFGLIDSLIYRDQLIDIIKEKCGTEESEKPDYVSMYKYRNVASPSVSNSEGKIALLYAEGNIVMGNGNSSNIGAANYTSVIRKIRESDSYKALVIRINSPGGNAIASDQIWREIELANKEIPVVVSMSNYAASGGYYIAAPSTTIFAHPTTLTGSIGVFGMFASTEELLNEKLGISTEAVKTNKYADFLSISRNIEPYEVSILQDNVDRTYDDFITNVSEGRNIEKSEVDLMGEGQVFSGLDAIEKGLVDRSGGLMEAIDEAAELASLENYTISEFPVLEDPYTKLLRSLSGDLRLKILNNELGESARFYTYISEIRSLSGIQARLPWLIHLY